MMKMRPLKERREYFNELNRRGFDSKEVIRLVPDDELQIYVRRGSELAQKELRRRNAIAHLHPMPRVRFGFGNIIMTEIETCIVCHTASEDLTYDEFLGGYVCKNCDMQREIRGLDR
jgi:hypothetical protein